MTPGLWEPHQEGFARHWMGLAGLRNQEVFHALAFLVWVQDQGHVCLPLDRAEDLWTQVGRTWLDQGLSPPFAPEVLIRTLGELPPVLVSEDSAHPLRRGSSGNLYLQKMWRFEDRLCRRLESLLMGTPPWGTPSPRTDAPLYAGLSLRQREALGRALRHRLFLLSGGPGTGKTFSLFQILLQILGARPDLKIALAAPTGRAAARIQESLDRAARGAPTGDLFWDQPLARLRDLPAQTLHRLIGASALEPRPRFHQDSPLPYELVVVDEASMVDLRMMGQLLEALPDTAALLLVGDKDQLPSVESGALLNDLSLVSDTGPLRERFLVLTENQRLQRGDADSAAVLESLFRKTVGFTPPRPLPGEEALEDVSSLTPEEILAAWREAPSGAFAWEADWPLDRRPGYRDQQRLLQTAAAMGGPYHRDLARACRNPQDGPGLLKTLEEGIVLSAVRRGPWGTEALNRLFSQHLAPGARDPFPGMPWLVTRNLYDWEVFNGDRGLVVEREGRLFVLLPATGETRCRFVPLSLLRAHGEGSWALTVHASQGSEFHQVLFFLPPESRGLLTREILYTGMTRARSRAVVCASEDLARQALNRRVERFSGIKGYFQK